MAITLRGYQEAAIQAVRADWSQGAKRTIVSMPTGTGKTWLFVFLIFAASQNGFRCLVLVNTDEQVQQTVEKLGRVGVASGVVKGRLNEWTRDVVVASVQTLSRANRLAVIPKHWFGLVIVDECHYANAQSYQRVLSHLAADYCLGVTATPFRGDKQSLAEAGWQSVSFVYALEDAILDKWLVPLQVERVDTGVVLDTVGSRTCKLTGEVDFSRKSLGKRVNTPERNNKIVDSYLERMEGARVIGFAVTVEHAWAMANAFRNRGIEAHFLHGMTPMADRMEMLRRHRKGDFQVLTNCNVLTHGYDDPTLQGVIMARPTRSKVLYVQSVGRGLRPSEGKDKCLLLDVVDVSRNHDLAINAELLGLKLDLGQRPSLDGSASER